MMNISEYTLPPVLQPENVHLMARSYTSPCFTLRSWTLILTYLDPSFALTTAANRSFGQHIYEQRSFDFSKLQIFGDASLLSPQVEGLRNEPGAALVILLNTTQRKWDPCSSGLRALP